MTGVRRRGPGDPASPGSSLVPPSGSEGPRRGRSTWHGPIAPEATSRSEDRRTDPGLLEAPEEFTPGPRRKGKSAALSRVPDAPGREDEGSVARPTSTDPEAGARRDDPTEGVDVGAGAGASPGGEDPPADDDTAAEESPPTNPWKQPRTILLAVIAGSLAIILVIMVVLILRPKAADPVAISVPVALTGIGAPKDLKLGVVVSIGQGAVEGAEWASAAEGAAVARSRIIEGGSEISLLVENDHGTADGAKTAVTSLVEQGASGIVFATSGEHLAAGVAAASEAKVPAVLAYEPIPDASQAKAVWTLAPSEKALEAAYRAATKDFANPVLITAGPGVPESLSFAETLRPKGTDLAGAAETAAARTGADASAHHAYTGTDLEQDGGDKAQPKDEKKPADALVISGNARSLATLVKELQSRNVSVPLVLAPAAGSPGFAQALAEQDGSVSASLETIGVNVGDAAALGNGTQARAASAFLQEVRQLAADPEAKNLTGDAPFADVAPWADVRSHDAVLALTIAAGKAGSTDPERIAKELAKLQLTAADGIAGTLLDFREAQASSGKVQLLHATGQSLGLRPTGEMPLTWFPAPDSGQ